MNGQKAFEIEISKARQVSLLESLNLPYPKTRVINSPSLAVAAAENLRFPIVVKANIGGSGAGIVRFDSREGLISAVESGKLNLGIDQTALVQEFVPPRNGYITRVETTRRRRNVSSSASPTSNNSRPVTRIISNGWLERDWSSRFRSRITVFRIAVFVPD